MEENHDLEQITGEMIGIAMEFYRLGPRLKAMLARNNVPPEITAGITRMTEGHTLRETHRAQDHEMYYRVGSILRRREVMTMTQLSEALVIPQSTATRLVDSLVETGFAERLADPGDRRVVRVALTNAGEQLMSAFDTYVGRRLAESLRELSPAEQSTLVRLLRKVLRAMEPSP